MYKISVPVMNRNLKRAGRERTLAELRRMDAERVFLALDTYETDPSAKKAVMEELADNCRFFQSHGLEVGAWTWTFRVKNNRSFANMRTIAGKECKDFACPTDEAFLDFASEYIKDIARTGVDIIQFDDDFRYGFLSSTPACLCDSHLQRIAALTGEAHTREEMEQAITRGGKNKLRDAYLQVNGDVFRAFARRMRREVDSINPRIRISLCACLSSWDIDGTTAEELATVLAGKTKPIMRLIGAPYWAVKQQWGNCLQDTVELERMERAWTRAEGIEIMAEGDAYPRPRSACPASYLEGFDTAIRASGCTDGILKYGIDYHSNADYELGYADRHERGRALYAEIDRMFGGKVSVGVRVYESMQKVACAVTPTAVNTEISVQDLIFSKAARTLAHNSIPSVYEGEGVAGIVFDENARALKQTALEKGLILDIAAAEILTERGIDVGLLQIGAPEKSFTERFLDSGNQILTDGATVYALTLKEGAELLSVADTDAGTLPVSYRYENADGQRFLVLNVNTREKNCGALKHYARSRQYADLIPWLGGTHLPAYIYGAPALYLQCKKDSDGMAVGLWNFFADSVPTPTVQLDGAYTSAVFLNCTGTLDGDTVRLSELPPFGFAAFEVKK